MYRYNGLRLIGFIQLQVYWTGRPTWPADDKIVQANELFLIIDRNPPSLPSLTPSVATEVQRLVQIPPLPRPAIHLPVAQPICNGIVALLLLLLLICSQLVMANCVELALIWRITVNYLIDMLCQSVCVMAFVCGSYVCLCLCVCVNWILASVKQSLWIENECNFLISRLVLRLTR